MPGRDPSPVSSVFDDRPAPLDESALLACAPLEARDRAEALPLATRFQLRQDITPIQWAFLQKHGFLVFSGVVSPEEVDQIQREIDQIEAELLATGERKVHGVPVWFGTGPSGQPWLQRMGFASAKSPWLEALVTDARFEPIRQLIGAEARIGTREKDGVVYNRYANFPGSLRPDLAWHTDALRDVFYNGEMPGPMLNVGLHFDRVRPEDGGLRLLPGTHTQSAFQTLFRKIHFVTQDDDPAEVMVETWPGDLTVHDGRAWHRVKASPKTGLASLRRSMYVPYVIDTYQPKDAQAKTNAYMRVFDGVMRAKGWWARRQAEASRPR
jgi:hypothetical protein